MARWILKAALQRCFDLLPCSRWWNEQCQKRLTRSIELTEAHFTSRLRQCRRHLENLEQVRGQFEGFTAFDLGTGWHPVVPVGLYCCGASKVVTCDIAPLLTVARVRECFQRFVNCHDAGKLNASLPQAIAARVEGLRELLRGNRSKSPGSLLEQTGIDYRVRDACNTGLEPSGTDLIASAVTMEYIPEKVLPSVLRELHRIAAADAVLSVSVDLADQYAYFDRSITPFNFLKFSNFTWRCINSSLIRLNRLRISDYRDLLNAAGFEIREETPRLGELSQPRSVKLAPRFRNYPIDDLLVLHAWLVATPRKDTTISTSMAEEASC